MPCAGRCDAPIPVIIEDDVFTLAASGQLTNQPSPIPRDNPAEIEECLFSTDQYGLKTIFPSLNMRCTGCAALDLAYVGSGRLDGFFYNKINLWDIAAGLLIVREAGGTTNDIRKYSENNIDLRVASSSIYPKMMEKLGNF